MSLNEQEKANYEVMRMAAGLDKDVHAFFGPKVCPVCGGAGLVTIHSQKVVRMQRIHNCVICERCLGVGKIR